MQVHKCSPWYISISDLFQDAKMERRQAERTDCAQKDLYGCQKDRY